MAYMMDVELELTAECSVCGSSLEIIDHTNRRNGDHDLEIAPCADCIEAAKQAVRDEESGE